MKYLVAGLLVSMSAQAELWMPSIFGNGMEILPEAGRSSVMSRQIEFGPLAGDKNKK